MTYAKNKRIKKTNKKNGGANKVPHLGVNPGSNNLSL